jgi:hypothetical protein
MSEKLNAIQICISWANDSTNVFRQGTAEAAQRELAAYKALEQAVRERTKNALGIFDGGHGKRYAYCNDCHAIGETLDQGSIKHHRGCLVDALQAADSKPGG